MVESKKNKGLSLDEMIDISKKADWKQQDPNYHYSEGTYEGIIKEKGTDGEIKVTLTDYSEFGSRNKGNIITDLFESAACSFFKPQHTLGFFWCAMENSKERFMDRFSTSYSLRIEYSEDDKSYNKEVLGRYSGRSKKIHNLADEVKDLVDKKTHAHTYEKKERGMKYAHNIIRK